jgi:hypothetical protein
MRLQWRHFSSTPPGTTRANSAPQWQRQSLAARPPRIPKCLPETDLAIAAWAILRIVFSWGC